MNRKPAALIAGVAAFLLGGLIMRQATDWFHREPAIPGDILTRAWVEQSLGSDLLLTVPWHLASNELKLPAQVSRLVTSATTFSHEGDGLNIMTSHIVFTAGTAMNPT